MKELREFWVVNKDLGESGSFTKETFLCSGNKPAEKWFIYVREVIEIPSLNDLDKEIEIESWSHCLTVKEKLQAKKSFRDGANWMLNNIKEMGTVK